MRIIALLLLAIAGPLAPSSAAAQEPDELLTCGYLCSEEGAPLSTAGETPPDPELVRKIYLGAFSELCSWAIGGGPGLYEPEVFELSYRPAWIEADEPDRQLRLYRFFCSAGAYNQSHVHLTWTADEGVQAVSFAYPVVTYEYAGEDIDTKVSSIAMTGMAAKVRLVNSEFDPETGTLTEWSCWRGLCDASSRGEWRLDGGQFSLVTYDFDPSYDGEVNLYRVVDYTQAIQIDVSNPLPFTPPELDEE